MASGAIGELRVIRSAFSYSLYDADNIRLRTDVEGGALMDVGCYCVSGARLLGGEPESVLGAAHIGSSGTDWVFTGLMRFPGDVVALFDCGTSLPDRDELEAIGTEGSLFLDDPWHCQSPVIELRRDGSVERIEVEAANPYRLELEDLNAAIRGERPPLLGRADAIGQVRTIEALYRSAADGVVSRCCMMQRLEPIGGVARVIPVDVQPTGRRDETKDCGGCAGSGASGPRRMLRRRRFGQCTSTATAEATTTGGGDSGTLNGSVGPGFEITMAESTASAGKYHADGQRSGR